MMVTMHHVDYFTGTLAFCHPMKCKTVHDVFEKSPEQHSCKKNGDNIYRIKTQHHIAAVKHVRNNGQVHPPDYKRMRFGEHFKIIVLEKLCLAFIMNFFKFHHAYD